MREADATDPPAPGDNGSMSDTTIGLLHPGEMGAAVGQCLAAAGHQVLWVPEGRSPASAARAGAAGLTAADGGLAELAGRADVIVSVCPPHAALGRGPGGGGTGFGGVYLDANAVAPATAREVAAIVEAGGASYVDGGIIGTPPVAPGFIRLYLSGARPAEVQRAVRGHRGRRATGRARRGRRGGRGVGGEDGVRVVDQGIGRAAADRPGAGPGRGRGGRAAGGVGHLPARPGRTVGPARPGPRRARAGAGWPRWRRSPRPWPRPGCPTASTRPRPRSTAVRQAR